MLPESNNTITADHKEFAIGGTLVKTQIELSHLDAMSFRSDAEFKIHIKKKIVSQLVEHLIDANLVEVTCEHDHLNSGVVVRARAYLAPDPQIKILRTEFIK
jgi:hypothetical protein